MYFYRVLNYFGTEPFELPNGMYGKRVPTNPRHVIFKYCPVCGTSDIEHDTKNSVYECNGCGFVTNISYKGKRIG
ncbi:MAG: hypothetical protein HYS80_02520 [Candidatus Aenigmarchaeota archaeon]|nr:hypothetical protein [Candidatus Aenigmarchaeota archaeon]